MQANPEPVPPEFAQALRELGLAAPGEALRGSALTGGVSSDIWRIDTQRGAVCAKRALPKLRVAADWHAPIERNRYEARWMQVARQAVPGVLVMDYLPAERHALWKEQLRLGLADSATARAVGDTLGRIHAHSARRATELRAQFDTDRIFFDIRLEPYLLATAQRHADLAPALQALVAQTQSHPQALVHGDVSPKNILVRRVDGPRTHDAGHAEAAAGHSAADTPVLLDAECAWWGDPAFDLAFCLNHLLLKGLWTPSARAGYHACFSALAAAYLSRVGWEDADALERRAAALLPGLLLARVDGKSPVEYLTRPEQHEAVRRVARPLLLTPAPRLAEVAAAWQDELMSHPSPDP
jgi:fructosamine-3-kinase